MVIMLAVASCVITSYSIHYTKLYEDPVPALGWPGRTMTYRVDGKNILNGIQAGQKVDVQFSTTSPYDASAHFVTPAGQ